MSINLTDEIEVKTKKGKLGAAKQIFLEGDTQTVEKEIQDINSRHNALNTKHESLSRTVQGIAATGGASTATNVTYNNDSSGLNAENAQDAIDELQSSKLDKASILQESGEAEDKVMSQKATSTELNKKANKVDIDVELNKKFDKESVVQESGEDEDKVMSQKAITTAIADETTRAKAAEKTNTETITNEVARLDKKINDKTNEINVAKEEALQAIAENEQSVISNFNAQRVTPEMLSESTKQLIESSGGGTITNLADDEDLTSVDDGTGSNVLKFADRTYNPDNFSGKGYKILRKNIVGGNNILTQDMINLPNTIYEIIYDFDLYGKTLELPNNCTLKFKGGKLKNGKIKANNAIIHSIPMPIFSEIHIENTFSCEGYIDWFEPKNGYYDYSFSECLRSFSVVNFSKSNYIYTFSGNIIQTDDVKEGRVLKVNKSRLRNLIFLYNIKDDENPHVYSNSISIYDASFLNTLDNELPVIISGLGVNFYNCSWNNYKYCVGYISTYIDTMICVACSTYLCKYFFVTMNKLGELLTNSFIGDYFGFYKSSICNLSKFPLRHFTVTFSASLPFNLQLSSKEYGTNSTNITLLNCHMENNINRSIPLISDDGTCKKETIDAVINIIGGFYDIGLIDFTKYNIIHYNNVRFVMQLGRTTIDTYKLSIIHNISDIRGSICIGNSNTSFLFIDSENFNPLSNLYSTKVSLSYLDCLFINVNIPELTFDTTDTLEFNCFLSCFEDKISVGDNKLKDNWRNITIDKKGIMLLSITSSLNRSDIKNYYLHVFLIINNVIKRAVIPVYNFRRNNSYTNSNTIILHVTKLDVDLFELKPFEGNKSDIKYENLNSGDSRPINVNKGTSFFDNTVNKPIWWTGTKWIDATGADV